MNVHVVSACLLGVVVCTLAEAPGPYPASSGPYAPSGWKPSGQRFVLPARQQVSTMYGPPSQYGPPTTQPPPTEAAATEEATEAATEDTDADEEATPAPEGSEQLRDGGVYYVLLQDGNLQMVRYRTAPLRLQKQKSQRQQKAAKVRAQESQRVKAQKQTQLLQVQAHQAQFQPAQIQQQPSRVNIQPARSAQLNKQQQQPFHYVEIQKSHEIEVAQPPPERVSSGFSANIQYRDVEPISAPIFALNSAPLVRIL